MEGNQANRHRQGETKMSKKLEAKKLLIEAFDGAIIDANRKYNKGNPSFKLAVLADLRERKEKAKSMCENFSGNEDNLLSAAKIKADSYKLLNDSHSAVYKVQYI